MPGLLDLLLADPSGQNVGLLSQWLGLNTPATATRTPVASGPPGTALGLAPPVQSSAQSGVTTLAGAYQPSQGLLGNSILGNAARGALAGLGSAYGTRGFGAGIGAGFAGAAQQAGQRDQDAMRRQLFQQQQMQYQQSQAQAAKQQAADAARQQAINAAIAKLPPDQQAIAQADPEGFFAQYEKQMFPGADQGPKTVGGMAYNPQTHAFEPIPGYTEQAAAIAAAGRAPAPPPVPKSIEERDQETLLHGDPASPEYAMSYMRTFQTPRFVQGTNEAGQPTIVPIMPTIPPGIRPPVNAGSPPAAGGPQPGGSQPAPAANVPVSQGGAPQAGTPIVVGSQPKGQTEDARKNQQLLQRTLQQLPQIIGDGSGPSNYDELAKPKNLAAVKIGGTLGNMAMSGGAQVAYNGLLDLAASYLYSVSGATANPGEVQNLARTIMPDIGDGADTIASKKARIQQMVDSIKTRAGVTAPTPVAGAAAASASDPIGLRQ